MSNPEATYWREQYETELRKRQAAELQLALLQATPAQSEAAGLAASHAHTHAASMGQQEIDLTPSCATSSYKETLTRREIADLTGLSAATVLGVLKDAGIQPLPENPTSPKAPACYDATQIWDFLDSLGATREDPHLYRISEIAKQTGQVIDTVYTHAAHGKLKTGTLKNRLRVSGIRLVNEYVEGLKA